ncbi:MAG: nickel-dependent hydrogenase large subunit [Bacteroidales bacterium]
MRDVSQPIEALRVVHSFDPCLSCAVHVMRPGATSEVVVSRVGATVSIRRRPRSGV